MLGLVRPNTFVPIHGEVAFLREHAERARRAGVQEVHEIENGVGIVLKDEGVHLESLGVLDTWFDDGTRVGTFEELGMRDRVRLAYNGVVGVHVRWEGIPGAGEPVVDLDTRGLYTDEGRLLDRCRREVAGIVTGIGGTPGDEPMEDVIARAVRRFFKRDSGRRPEVMVFLAPRGAGERGSHGKG
jgi:ribonuclease J